MVSASQHSLGAPSFLCWKHLSGFLWLSPVKIRVLTEYNRPCMLGSLPIEATFLYSLITFLAILQTHVFFHIFNSIIMSPPQGLCMCFFCYLDWRLYALSRSLSFFPSTPTSNLANSSSKSIREWEHRLWIQILLLHFVNSMTLKNCWTYHLSGLFQWLIERLYVKPLTS